MTTFSAFFCWEIQFRSFVNLFRPTVLTFGHYTAKKYKASYKYYHKAHYSDENLLYDNFLDRTLFAARTSKCAALRTFEGEFLKTWKVDVRCLYGFIYKRQRLSLGGERASIFGNISCTRSVRGPALRGNFSCLSPHGAMIKCLARVITPWHDSPPPLQTALPPSPIQPINVAGFALAY